MNHTSFSSIKVVGGLLPADVLGRILAADPEVPAIGPESYGLQRGESVRRQASRSWDYLLGVWQEFQQRRQATPESQWTQLTRERWLHILLRELGFHDLRASGGIEVDGTSFPVSHLDEGLPVHVLAWATDLDHRTPGRTARAPESMLQELLNRSDAYLWAVLSNGSALRLLRDSRKLAGNAHVEFDLEAMFDGELFADFVVLFRVCQRSRFSGDPAPLEQWLAFAASAGTRALERLRSGVEEAIAQLGTGFLSHPSNPQLRHRLNGARELRIEDFNRALLRVVYRLLFWFVAEDRQVLLSPDVSAETLETYHEYFSSTRLRRLARGRTGSGVYGDLWDAMQLVFAGLGSEGGLPELGLPGLGGIFENGPLDEPLDGARLANRDLLAAVRSISVVSSRDGRRPVDFGNLGSEELGSVYEALLELVPRYDPEDRTYTLQTYRGNDRKESGSYYTPSSLVDCLLESTLDPLLDEASSSPDPVAALLNLTVCDPACGSGHFLVAAARRIARRVAAEETGESSPSEGAVRSALRRVVGRCVYGVDINPMAAELARVSLWLEAIEPGRPLTFLDASIRVGNSLLGVTPALLRDGVPDQAFKPLEGDDRRVASALKKQNAVERSGQGDLFSASEIEVRNAASAKEMTSIVSVVPTSLEDVHIQAARARELLFSPEREQAKLLADAWCAAFVQEKTEDNRQFAITDAVLRAIDNAPPETLDQVRTLTRDYRFFHWHVEFPHIFRTGNGIIDTDPATGWSGGFSCVIGNPPWEKIEVKEQEFFAQRDPKIADAANAAERRRRIQALATSDDESKRELYQDFGRELRRSAGWTHLLKESERYPLTGAGRLNTYAAFAETGRTVVASTGRFGFVLPTGIGTDATTAPFFRSLVQTSSLVAFLDFENEAFLLSRSVHHSVRFCLLAACGRGSRVDRAAFAFGTRHMEQLSGRVFTMPSEEILLVNPNTGTCPVFRSRHDAEITLDVYRRLPVLWRDDPEENPWGLVFMQGLFNMASDSGLFRTAEQLADDGWTLDGNVFVRDGERMLPLYEAKMIHHFDHRLGTYEGQTEAQANVGTLPRLTTEQKDDPSCVVMPRYWVPEFNVRDEERSTDEEDVWIAGVTARLKAKGWDKEWLLGWRDICRSTDERTMISGALPRVAAGHTLPIALTTSSNVASLYANLCSFVLDYVVRQKIAGTHLTYGYVRQFPVLPPDRYDRRVSWNGSTALNEWITSRVLELSWTAWDMEGFARDLGDDGAPFRWDEERRALLRAELDAAYFHLYEIERDDVEYIMETFPIVKRRDEEHFGEYRTKRLIREAYDAMADAIRTGVPYRSIVDPPPGEGPRHNPR
jgi:hypothetical protein